MEIIHSDENQTCVFVLTCTKDAEAVSDALRRIGFEYPSYISPVAPKTRERRSTVTSEQPRRQDP